MNLVTIAFKSIKQRALASSLTALSVALGVMLMVAVLVIFGILNRTFGQNAIFYDLIVGPKGSDLQLVLSTVYRVSPPIENLPYSYYKDLLEHPAVAEAVPIALGDVTEEGGFPIVGTNERFFELPYAPNEEFLLRGHGFEDPFDAIIGDQVAYKNGWDIGSQFKLVHGGQESDHVHNEKFTVVGIIKQTGTPNDKTVFIHLNGFYSIADHNKPVKEYVDRFRKFYTIVPGSDEDLELQEIEEAAAKVAPGAHYHGPSTDVTKEITSVLVRMKRPAGDPPDAPSIAAPLFASRLKKGFQAQGINPIIPMKRLLDNVVGNIQKGLVVMTTLIIIVSGVSIFVSIYNSMADRRREIAIMRALGASRQAVFTIILAESILLCFGGGLFGLLLGHGLVFVAAPIVASQTGLLIDPFAFETIEFVIVPSLIVLASIVGFIPGTTAYRTDVAEAIAD
jgi:putative ABC transport system permease protein